jgi:hypothetical protein
MKHTTRLQLTALLAVLTASWQVSGLVAHAAVQVKCEKGEIRDGHWVFPSIAGPSRNDLAQTASLRAEANSLEPAGQTEAGFTDGVVARDGGDAAQFVFFSNKNTNDGAILMDLGSVQRLRQINTYSQHVWDVDQGSRGPQVYTLYGSAAETGPGTAVPEKNPQWVKIAEVDSRPNQTGQQWGGLHSVQISADAGDLGSFRHLLWIVHRTRSPLQKDIAMTGTLFTEFDVHSAETLAQLQPATLYRANANVEEVIVVFKTHLDIGYTDLAAKVIESYRTKMIDHALDNMDRSHGLPPENQFQWMLAGWPIRQMLWPGQTPERRARIVKAIASGQLKWHGLACTTYTESMDPEDLVRSLGFSSGLSREFNLELPRDAKMTDVPEHIWLLPTVLKHAGVDILHLGCNSGSKPVDVPPLFWWEGPDGSRLLTAYSRDYGTGLIPPKNWPHKTWLAMMMTGDNEGPPKPEAITQLLDQARRALPGVRVKFGRLSDFADALLAEKPELPIVRADMPDTWIHGLLSMPVETKLVLNTRPQMAALGALDTQMRAWGLAPESVGAPLAEAYEQSLLYSEHTWGLNGGSVGFRYGDDWKKALARGHYAKFEKSFDEHRAHARRMSALVQPVLAGQMTQLANAVKVQGPRVVVFNPLPWKRDAVVRVKVPGASWPAVKDLASGRVILADQNDGELRFVATDLPATGYKTYVPASAAADRAPVPSAEAGVLENDFFKLRLNVARGGIASLVDKRTGRELVADDGDRALGQYLHERFDLPTVRAFVKAYNRGQDGWVWNDFGKPNLPGPDKLGYAALSPSNWMVTMQHTPNADLAVLRCAHAAPMAAATTLKITLHRTLPFVDLEWGVENKTPDPIPEGGWLCLPFAIEKPAFRLGRSGSIMDPAKDIIRGANRHLLCLNSGMTVTGPDGFGVGLCSPDTPLVSLEQTGLWKYSDDFVPQKASVFLNLYNNMWNTDFPLWVDGSWTARVRLWVVRGADTEAELTTPSAETRAECPAACTDGPGGKLPVMQEGLSLSRKGVLVTAFSPNPDGQGTVLRLWESAGKSGDCEVQLPAGLKISAVQPVDLRGRPTGQPIRLTKGAFTAPLRAFAPASYLFESD